MNSRFLVWARAQADADFQGIDFVEVKLQPAPSPGQLPTVLLVVHLQRPQQPPAGPFTADCFVLSGGRHAQAVSLALASQTVTTVTLTLGGIGDPSPYTLKMVDGAGAPVHPFFASASFTFRIECERGDCRPLPESSPRRIRERPPVDLVTKDYAGFLSLASEWIKVKNPHWADLSPASLERVLVELLSHHGDMLSYYQDRVANEAFIENASARHSLRQHGTLLGTSLFDGSAAETVLAFAPKTSGHISEGTEVTILQDAVETGVVFHVTERARVVPEHSSLQLAAWPGAVDAVVPAGATEVLLYGSVPELRIGQRLAFVQGELGQPASTTQIVVITSIVHEVLPGWVTEPTVAGPNPTPIAVTIIGFDPPLERACTPWTGLGLRIHGNLAGARFGAGKHCNLHLTARACIGHQDYVVEERSGHPPRLRALRVPLAPVVHRAVVAADGTVVSAPLLTMSLDEEPWTRVPHLHGSQPYDRHYVATADEDGSVWIEFGDGVRGRSIELGTGNSPAHRKLDLTYYVGDVIAGNCGTGVLRRFVPGEANRTRLNDFDSLPEVFNVLPGVGGREAEPRDTARLRLPASLRRGPLQRAVTLADYAAAARSVKGVARAVARDIGGPFNAVLVLCDPEGRSELTPAVAAAVNQRIDAVRMAGREHFVSAPTYVPIELVLSVCHELGSPAHRVRNSVLAALLPGDDDTRGFFHPDALSFGEDIELADVLAAVQRIPGVRAVKARRFHRADVLGGPLVVPRISLGATEVARLDGDPRAPEHGRLTVLVDDSAPQLDDPTRYAPYLVEESP